MSAFLLALAALPAPPQTATCDPAWLTTFGFQPGLNGEVSASVAFDDGSGPKL